MIDTILYRRFFIVVLVIAAFGVLAANVILETRQGGYGRPQAFDQPGTERCLPSKICLGRMARFPAA
jgi:hypothetical protein